jgi:superfamily II DNA/RNA helicase
MISFKSTPNSILLATDIAARGLDIPAVDHVLHYQLPRTADAYVHRNGRTARASRSGFSLLMCAPDERRVLHGLLSSLHRGVWYSLLRAVMQRSSFTTFQMRTRFRKLPSTSIFWISSRRVRSWRARSSPVSTRFKRRTTSASGFARLRRRWSLP